MQIYDLRSKTNECLDHPVFKLASLLIDNALSDRSRLIVEIDKIPQEGLEFALKAYGFCIENISREGDVVVVDIYRCSEDSEEKE